MSNNCLAGFPAFGPRVDTNITYYPRITEFDPVVELPTSEPATAQVQFTIAEADLPTFSPYPIPWLDSTTLRHKCLVYAYVHNGSGGTATVYAKRKTANTPAWSSATSVSATNGYWYCYAGPGINTFAVGDTQEVKLYASAAGVKLIKAFMVVVHVLVGTGLPTKLANLEIDFATDSLFGGTGLVYGTTQCYTLHNPIFDGKTSTAVAINQALWPLHSINGILTVGSVGPTWQVSTTDVMKHESVVRPTRIAYTPIL